MDETKKIDDGGPAFPTDVHAVAVDKEEAGGVKIVRERPLVATRPGMSYRQWIEGQALAGILASGKVFKSPCMTESDVDSAVKLARRAADRMLAARKVGGTA